MIKYPTLERIWEARRRIYEKCGNDPVKLVEYYLKRQQKQSSDLLIAQNDVIHPQEAVCQNFNVNGNGKLGLLFTQHTQD